MQELYKYLLTAVVFCWFMYEVYHLFKFMLLAKNLIPQKALVIKVEKWRSYNSASLLIEARLSDSGQTIKLTSSFFPNLRWWLQKIPKENSHIYFTLKKENGESDKDKIAQKAYGLSMNKPASISKLIADLFYDFSASKSIFFWGLLLGLLIIHKYFFFEYSFWSSFCYLYMVARTFISALIV